MKAKGLSLIGILIVFVFGIALPNLAFAEETLPTNLRK